jgi:hypothetical protein
MKYLFAPATVMHCETFTAHTQAQDDNGDEFFTSLCILVLTELIY